MLLKSRVWATAVTRSRFKIELDRKDRAGQLTLSRTRITSTTSGRNNDGPFIKTASSLTQMPQKFVFEKFFFYGFELLKITI
jgi:hypothetical protein